MKIKCNKCGIIGEHEEFRKGRDFFQREYVAGCPKCDNSQNPGDASMRMFGGLRPFQEVNEPEPIKVTDKLSALDETMRRANTVA